MSQGILFRESIFSEVTNDWVPLLPENSNRMAVHFFVPNSNPVWVSTKQWKEFKHGFKIDATFPQVFYCARDGYLPCSAWFYFSPSWEEIGIIEVFK